MKAWSRVSLIKRPYRNSFAFRTRNDGKEEFILKVPGFSGELRKIMTPKEAEEWVANTNEAAFMAAASASASGIYGVEEFAKNGRGGRGLESVIAKYASKAFADRGREDGKLEGSRKK